VAGEVTGITVGKSSRLLPGLKPGFANDCDLDASRFLLPAVVVQCQPHPIVEPAFPSDDFRVDVHIAAIRTSSHDHSAAAFAFEGSVVNRGINSAHDSLLANTDAHLSPDHEDKTAEHPFFLHGTCVS